MPDRGIAECVDRLGRERLVDALQLLEAGDVRRELLEPATQHMEARVDPVDVVACDSKGAPICHRSDNLRRGDSVYESRVAQVYPPIRPPICRAIVNLGLDAPLPSAMVASCL